MSTTFDECIKSINGFPNTPIKKQVVTMNKEEEQKTTNQNKIEYDERQNSM